MENILATGDKNVHCNWKKCHKKYQMSIKNSYFPLMRYTQELELTHSTAFKLYFVTKDNTIEDHTSF